MRRIPPGGSLDGVPGWEISNVFNRVAKPESDDYIDGCTQDDIIKAIKKCGAGHATYLLKIKFQNNIPWGLVQAAFDAEPKYPSDAIKLLKDPTFASEEAKREAQLADDAECREEESIKAEKDKLMKSFAGKKVKVAEGCKLIEKGVQSMGPMADLHYEMVAPSGAEGKVVGENDGKLRVEFPKGSCKVQLNLTGSGAERPQAPAQVTLHADPSELVLLD